MAISQLRLNSERCGLGFMVQYMQWIQLYYHLLLFGQLQDGDIQDGGIQIGVLLLSCTHVTLCRTATFDHYI